MQPDQMILDKETQQTLRTGQILADGVKGDFWNYVKGQLEQKVTLLDSLEATIFDGKSDEEIAHELKARAASVRIIKGWIAEVEASAEQHQINATQITNEEYLIQI